MTTNLSIQVQPLCNTTDYLNTYFLLYVNLHNTRIFRFRLFDQLKLKRNRTVGKANCAVKEKGIFNGKYPSAERAQKLLIHLQITQAELLYHSYLPQLSSFYKITRATPSLCHFAANSFRIFNEGQLVN